MRRTTRLMVLMVGAASLVWAGLASAQEQHKHGHEEAPAGSQQAATAPHTHGKCMLHGGQVSMTKQHHFETVFAPDGIRVYIYTDLQAPAMVEGAKGAVTLTFKDGKKKAVPLAIETPAADEKAVYFCPMHTDVVQMEPGECKLCGGMKLFTQDRLFAKVDLSKVEPGTLTAIFSISGLAGSEPQVMFTEHSGKPVAPPTEAKPEGQAPASGKKTEETN